MISLGTRRSRPLTEHERTLLDAIHAKALQEAELGEEHEHGCTGPALIAVAALGDLERMSELLEAGVNVDEQDRRGYTAVISAARYDRQEIVSTLIAKGASLNLATYDGWTPLVMCARKGLVGMARMLLDAGADGEYMYNGSSCAEIADAKGHAEVAAIIRGHAEKGATRAPP